MHFSLVLWPCFLELLAHLASIMSRLSSLLLSFLVQIRHLEYLQVLVFCLILAFIQTLAFFQALSFAPNLYEFCCVYYSFLALILLLLWVFQSCFLALPNPVLFY